MALQDYNHSTNFGDSYWISVLKMKCTEAKMTEKEPVCFPKDQSYSNSTKTYVFSILALLGEECCVQLGVW